MTEQLRLRRHLYECMAGAGRLGRRRRALRRQIALLSGPGDGPDDGRSGVREPRRPSPHGDPAGRARRG